MREQHTPQVSVIVPVFNQAGFVADCIASIRAQTMHDIEVLLIDDGSTDDSPRIMRRAIEGDDRFTVLEQPNQGVAVARNAGLEASHGDWICFIDPDDTVDPGYLDTLLQAVAEHPHTDVVMSACVAVGDAGAQRQHFFPHDFTVTTEDGKRALYHQLMDGAYGQQTGFVTAIGVPWGKLYRRGLLENEGLRFDAQLPRMQDNLFNMEVFHAAHELVYVDYAGYRYRMGGLGARTLANTAKGLYHPAIDKRADLMHAYALDADAELRAAWNIEQVNLYYQEIKAVAMLAPNRWNGIREACWRRARQLRRRLAAVDRRTLPKPIRLKYMMLTNRALNAAAAMMFWRERRH